MLSQVLKAGSRNNESTHFSLYREPTHRFFCVSTWRLNKIYICVQVLCCSLNNRVCVYLQLIYILAAEAARKPLPVNWRSVRRLYKGLIKARICGFFFYQYSQVVQFVIHNMKENQTILKIFLFSINCCLFLIRATGGARIHPSRH